MKTKIYNCYLYILHILVFVSCYLNSAKLCAYLIKLSLFKQKDLNKKIYNKKITLVLYRAIGERYSNSTEIFKKNTSNILYEKSNCQHFIFFQ